MQLRWESILSGTLLALALLTGCVKEDANCTVNRGNTGIDLSFYSFLSCQTDTIYPDTLNHLIVGVFNQNNLLVAHNYSALTVLNGDSSLTMEIPSGLYTVVAWSGMDASHYIISELQDSITTKNELLFRLRREEGTFYPITGTEIYYGESTVYVPEAKENSSYFEKVAINIRELTNRITLTVEGIPAEYFEIGVESANGSMNIDGTIASDSIVAYTPDYRTDTGLPEAAFTTLKLETGYSTTIVIRDITSPTQEEIFRGDLLGTLLFKNPEINLACDHDFTIRFTVQDQCNCGTYTIAEIWVNNWLVHSYDTNMN